MTQAPPTPVPYPVPDDRPLPKLTFSALRRENVLSFYVPALPFLEGPGEGEEPACGAHLRIFKGQHPEAADELQVVLHGHQRAVALDLGDLPKSVQLTAMQHGALLVTTDALERPVQSMQVQPLNGGEPFVRADSSAR